jgi:asparagine synthase (glutamine-hydrolysing)
MSGIVGIANVDGAPVDDGLLRTLTSRLSGRGPDAQRSWTQRHVGLGHALLRITEEAENEQQPSTLDGEVWITADARVDGRAELARQLAAAGQIDRRTAESRGTADNTLVLHAYLAWGERCVEHLLGDFAFAIWDGRQQRLFCARDQLGVKPLFFAVAGGSLVFASELECVRSHPSVADDLDDLAIADFLLFGQQQDLDATAFSHIRRLPPAHYLSWDGDRTQVKRYWEPSQPPCLLYRRATEYVDHFDELLRTAVADRTRADPIGVLMSGGVDSPLVAASARGELERRHHAFELQAHTVIFESLIPDSEKRYANIAAEALGIPIRYHPRDSYPLFGGTEALALSTPEPSAEPFLSFHLDLMREIGSSCRVALSGYDGDAVCQVWLASHFKRLATSHRVGRLFSDATRFAVMQRSLPPIGFRARLERRRERRTAGPQFPPWINPTLAKRFDLRTRWRQHALPALAVDRPVRADSTALLTGPPLPDLFNAYDPALTRVPLSWAHPLLDLRIISYVHSLPPIPWCVDKMILRRAAGRVLPAAIHRRAKTPLAADPARSILPESGGPAIQEHRPAALAAWVTPSALPAPHALKGSDLLWPRLFVISLDHWMALRES